MTDQADIIQGFMLEQSSLRGRIVRLGPVLDEILEAHAYPEPLARLTGEAAILAVLLSSMLKYDGIFTLQAQGEGPVSMVVADMTSDGALRACAGFKDGQETTVGGTLREMMGTGYLAFTVDQQAADRYQGIVELQPDHLVSSVRHYFLQSEQVMTGIKLSVDYKDGHWHAAGLILQHVPEEGGHAKARGNVDEDDWRRTMMLLETCTDEELLDLNLPVSDLLYRLFHEEGVRVYEPTTLSKGCRCDIDRLRQVLAMMPDEDRADMVQDGKITMNCRFCNRDFIFDPREIEHKINP